MSSLVVFTVLLGTVLSCAPEQPVLTMGNNDTSVTFSFVSASPCQDPMIILNNSELQTVTQIQKGTEGRYGSDPQLVDYDRLSYFFSANIIEGDDYSWSIYSSESQKVVLGPFSFKIKNGNTQKFIVISDMDISNISAPTVSALKGLDWSQYDGFIHGGDFAYDIEDDNGLRGDQYFDALATFTTRTPYLIVAGNHENYNNGLLFDYRFRMSNYKSNTTNNFWSLRKGQIFFLFVNYDYFLNLHKDQFYQNTALKYVESLLVASNKIDSKHPTLPTWRVVVTHRPIYCGDMGTNDCTINLYALKPFEELYRKYKVDVRLESHEHFYEMIRFVDTTMRVVQPPEATTSTAQDRVYVATDNPLVLISGCAGNSEWWLPSYDTNGLSALSVQDQQCYMELTTDETTLKVSLLLAQDNSLRDRTTLVRGVLPGTNSWKYWKYWFVPVLVVFALFGVYFWYKFVRSQSTDTAGAFSQVVHEGDNPSEIKPLSTA